MSDPLLGSCYELLANRQKELEALIEQGIFKPFFLHQILFFICIPLFALAIPCRHRRVSRVIRYVAFFAVVGLGLETLLYRRAFSGGGGYALGLAVAWWSMWSTTILVFNETQRDFKRIERRAGLTESPTRPTLNDKGYVQIGNGKLNDQSYTNGARIYHRSKARPQHVSGPSKKASTPEVLRWQPYPEHALHRLSWVLGLLFEMRGPGWNWRISTLEPLPRSVQAQLNERDSDRRADPSEDEDAKNPDATTVLNTAFANFFVAYVAVDLLKILAMRDPYFWGISQNPTSLFSVSRLYHLSFTGLGVFFAITYLTSLKTIVFLGLAVAFPGTSRALTLVPLDAPWLYSRAFSPSFSSILDGGLAGCWGQWWHQCFRFIFVSGSRWFLSLLPPSITKRRYLRHAVYLLVASSLSGALHAAGSYTQPVATKPLSGAFLFFILQAPGIVLQQFLSAFFSSMIFPNGVPQVVRRTVNVVFVVLWFILTGPLLADDFARGGLWIFEPLPFSPIRGLRLGGEGEGWLCWREPWFRVVGNWRIRLL